MLDESAAAYCMKRVIGPGGAASRTATFALVKWVGRLTFNRSRFYEKQMPKGS